ncbi:MAG: hypothetical protein FWH01_08085 [Oscillospiraceae bacterium]|nr:hypothetical protein [Oscillospiraceae bacterium]
MGKAEQIRALENGKGIQFLLNCAYTILGNPIYVIDINYNLLAYTTAPIDDHNWNELIATGSFGPKTLEVLANEGLIESITNAARTVTLRNEKLKYAKMAGHFFNRDNIEVGIAMMTECNVPFDAQSAAAFEMLADKITDEIRTYDYFTMLAMTFHENKINLLLDGAVTNPLLYNPQAQVLYNGFDDYLYVAVVHVEKNDILDSVHRNRLEYYKSMLKAMFPLFKYSVYADHIVILMSSINKKYGVTPFLNMNADLFERNGFCVGISESFESIYELRIYYDQAVAALPNGIRN